MNICRVVLRRKMEIERLKGRGVKRKALGKIDLVTACNE